MLAVPFKQTGVVGDSKPRYWVRIFQEQHYTQHNDIQLNDTQYNDIQYNNLKNHDTQHNDT